MGSGHEVKPKRKARQLALQALYEIDCTGHDIQEVLSARIADGALPDNLWPFLYKIVSGVIEYHEAMDLLIQDYATNWPLDQMAIIDRNILRLALYEFAIDNQTPMKVAINEAVELAKVFGADNTPPFINGVLGSLANDHRRIRKILQTKQQQAD